MLKIGNVVFLELENRGKIEKCKCRVVELEPSQFYIDYPINLETNRTVFLLDGTQVKISFVSQDSNSVYLFEAEVLGRVKDGIPMLVLSYPGDHRLMKIQRRQYVRVDATIDVAVHPVQEQFPPFLAITEDISAGGAAVRVRSTTEIHPTQQVKVWLVLPISAGEYRYLKVDAVIVRVVEIDSLYNRVSLQFNNLSKQDTQTLIRFSFDRQLSLKKKGII